MKIKTKNNTEYIEVTRSDLKPSARLLPVSCIDLGDISPVVLSENIHLFSKSDLIVLSEPPMSKILRER